MPSSYPSYTTRTSIVANRSSPPPSSPPPSSKYCSLTSCSLSTRTWPLSAVGTMSAHGSHQYNHAMNGMTSTSHSVDNLRNNVYNYHKTPDAPNAFASSSTSTTPPSLSSYHHKVAASTPVSPCLECVVDCNDATCSISPTSASKTHLSPNHPLVVAVPCSDTSCADQCIVVPCNDSSHVIDGGNACFDDSCFDAIGECFDAGCVTREPCAMEECFGGESCAIDHLCCADPYAEFMQSQSPVGAQTNMQYYDWSRSPAGLPLSVTRQENRYSGHGHEHHTGMHMYPTISHGADVHSNLTSRATHSHSNPAHHSQQLPLTSSSKSTSIHSSSSTSPTLIRCMWGNCQETFASMNELVGHVNLTHLRPQAQTQRTLVTSAQPFVVEQRIEKQNGHTSSNSTHSLPLSCMWENCQTFPDLSGLLGVPAAASEASASSSNATINPGSLQWDAAMQLLSSHLLHDHLGLVGGSTVGTAIALGPVREVNDFLNSKSNDPIADQPPTGTSIEPKSTHLVSPLATGTNADANVDPNSPCSHPIPIPTPSASPPPSPPHDCSTSQHICRWTSPSCSTPCNASFATCALLSAHLASEHVGAGRSSYECHWEGCSRKGDQGFGSKQKVLRHLQSHTGHRPFRCEVCGLWFSEAATLGQHMRRHTQEKPFVCDFPGCAKAFAIAGALTIHKRTHNGERPFKCPHCDRAFAESSNLSKHLRTHTGARPYVCQEPGCEKAFARPDQLQRHSNVHKKAASSANGNAGSSAQENKFSSGVEVRTVESSVGATRRGHGSLRVRPYDVEKQ